MSSKTKYVLGAGPQEIERLGKQHQLFAKEARALWTRAGFKKGQTIMDLGGGPGFASFELSKLVGNRGKVITVDLSQPFLDYLNQTAQKKKIRNIESICSDAVQMNIPRASINHVYSRFFLIFIKDLYAVAKKVFTILKPGGTWAMCDLAGYYPHFLISPITQSWYDITEAAQKMVKHNGGNFSVLLNMPKVLQQVGFEIEEIKPVVKVGRPHEPLWHWEEMFFRNISESLIDEGFLSQKAKEAFWKDWKKLGQNPSAFFITPPLLDIIAVKK